MPCYFYMNRKRQDMDEEVFDQMLQALHQPNIPDETLNTVETSHSTASRWRPDGTYDKRPLDPEYFSKYYRHKLKTPFKCPDCGRTLSSKSNLSKHRETIVCKRHQRA